MRHQQPERLRVVPPVRPHRPFPAILRRLCIPDEDSSVSVPHIPDSERDDVQPGATASKAVPVRRWRRAFVTSSLLLALVGAGLTLAPTVLLQTRLRDHIIGSAVGDSGWTTHCSAASGGWFSPLRFEDIVIRDADDCMRIEAEAVILDRGLLTSLLSPGDLGRVRVLCTNVIVSPDADGNWPLAACQWVPPADCTLDMDTVQLNVLRSQGEEPLVRLRPPTVTVHIGPHESGQRAIRIDACRILDDELIRSTRHHPLALVAPVLSQVSRLQATVTMQTDPVTILLDPETGAPQDMPHISGVARIHACDAHLNPDWVQQLLRLINATADTRFPDHLTVAENSEVRFEVRKDGVWHESMVFLLPDFGTPIEGRSSGMIRFDETVDLRLDVRIPPTLVAGTPWLDELLREIDPVIPARVVGSIDVPVLDVPTMDELVALAAQRVMESDDGTPPPPVAGAVLNLIRTASDSDTERRNRSLTGAVLGVVRSISRRKTSESPPEETPASDAAASEPSRTDGASTTPPPADESPNGQRSRSDQ